MSADIGVFHSSEMDDASLLPEGWYIGAMRENVVEEATGPYLTEALAYAGMGSKPSDKRMFADWLCPVHMLPPGIVRHRFDGATFKERT